MLEGFEVKWSRQKLEYLRLLAREMMDNGGKLSNKEAFAVTKQLLNWRKAEKEGEQVIDDLHDADWLHYDKEAKMLSFVPGTASVDDVEEDVVDVDVVSGVAPVSDDCFVVPTAPARPRPSASATVTSGAYEAGLLHMDNMVMGPGDNVSVDRSNDSRHGNNSPLSPPQSPGGYMDQGPRMDMIMMA